MDISLNMVYTYLLWLTWFIHIYCDEYWSINYFYRQNTQYNHAHELIAYFQSESSIHMYA